MFGAVWKSAVFYVACAKWAASGTLEKANAWFWLIGVPLVAVGGLWLGLGKLHIPDNPEGFLAFMAITVGVSWLIFFAVRFLGAGPHLYQELKDKNSILQSQLTAIGSERPLAYSHTEFNQTTPKHKHFDLNTCVYFLNNGDRLMRWRLRDYSVELNGAKLPPQSATTDYFINKGQKSWFHFPTFKGAPFNGWPLVIDVSFSLEYDNVPPVSARTSKRTIRFTIPAANAKNILAFEIFAEEK